MQRFRFQHLFFLLSLVPVKGIPFHFEGNPASAEKKGISGVTVSLVRSGNLQLEAPVPKKVKMRLTGFGVRSRQILFLRPNIYFIQSYIEQSAPHPQTLSDWARIRYAYLRLTLVRSVTHSQMTSSFEKGFEVNGWTKSNLPVMTTFLQGFDFDLSKASELEFVAIRNSRGLPQQIVFSQGNGKSWDVRGEKIADALWSIWFGKPVDNQMEELQKQLLLGGRSS